MIAYSCATKPMLRCVAWNLNFAFVLCSTGYIPQEFGELEALEVLRLSDNLLSGDQNSPFPQYHS